MKRPILEFQLKDIPFSSEYTSHLNEKRIRKIFN